MRVSLLIGGFVTLAVCAGSVNIQAEEPAAKFSAAQQQFYLGEVLPLLKAKCLGCHGEGKELEGNFDMRTRAALLKGGEQGPGAIPGNAEKSALYKAVMREQDLAMPPQERNALDIIEIDTLRRWIDMGLPWGESPTVVSDDLDPKTGLRLATSGGLDSAWTNRRYKPEDIWAFLPMRQVEVPKVDAALAQMHGANPIDAFILKQLAEKKITPAGDASPRDWLRRATFDLTGLPPTPAEMAAFEARVKELQSATTEKSVDAHRLPQIAVDEVIERLLASPHYGERMFQHWGDVVRYADSGGFAADWERPHAWRYRDYVVRSFNADKPYDRFVIEQIAGDELDPDDPEMKVAVGFLRMGPWEHTSMSIAEVTRQQYLDDVTNSVGVTFLGQGMTCAQCHDHKFDPIPTRDYYRLQAAFATSKGSRVKTPFLPNEQRSDFPRLSEEVERVAAPKDWMTTDSPDSYTLYHVKDKRGNYMKLAQRRFEPYTYALVPNGLPVTKILHGGSLESPGAVVSPGVLSGVRFAAGTPNDSTWNLPDDMLGRRLALAKWIADPRNPLTARVMVNRVWQMHFGRGLVATPNNFGSRGAKPANAELLDWLAAWFIAHDWSVKDLHRLIMSSQGYRRASAHEDAKQLAAIDPHNDLLAYFSPRRLTAEEIRDAMLAASGELNDAVGGPAVFPEINWEAALQPRHIVGTIAPAYQPSPTKSDRDRRSIYAFHRRTLADPLQEVLNKPSADISCERRDETVVTPHVFGLFNSDAAHQRALAFAARLKKEHADPSEQIRAAFQLTFNREPSADELAKCLTHVEEMTAHHRDHLPTKRELPTSVKRETIDQHTGAPVRWEEKLHWLMDYQRDLMPWDVDAQTRALAEVCLVLLNANEFVYVY